MAFKLKLEPLAKFDIQHEINYYNSKQKGLGKRFHSQGKLAFNAIRKNPLVPAYIISGASVSLVPFYFSASRCIEK